MDVYNTALANWKQKNPGRSLTKKQEERMLETVRNRIAAQHGFYNTSHAAKGVAFKYANYLLYNVRNNTPEAKMCEAMIRGLGLDFKYDPQHPEDNVPTEADIVKKMCG